MNFLYFLFLTIESQPLDNKRQHLAEWALEKVAESRTCQDFILQNWSSNTVSQNFQKIFFKFFFDFFRFFFSNFFRVLYETLVWFCQRSNGEEALRKHLLRYEFLYTGMRAESRRKVCHP